MALVSDIHTPDIAYTPYQRPPDAAAIRTPIPRGLKSFVVRGAVLAAKPVNDDLLLTVNWTLPGGFGYILNELHLNIVVDRAIDYREWGILRVSSVSTALTGFDYRYPIFTEAMSNAAGANNVRGTYVRAGTLMRTPIVPGQAGSTASLSFANQVDTVQAAGTVDALISFWEYDLEQIVWYAANMAIGVMAR